MDASNFCTITEQHEMDDVQCIDRFTWFPVVVYGIMVSNKSVNNLILLWVDISNNKTLEFEGECKSKTLLASSVVL